MVLANPILDYVSPYDKQTWVDGESPLNQERMNHIEAGISNSFGKIIELDSDFSATIEAGLSASDLFHSLFYANNASIIRPLSIYSPTTGVYFISIVLASGIEWLGYDVSSGQLNIVNTSSGTT